MGGNFVLGVLLMAGRWEGSVDQRGPSAVSFCTEEVRSIGSVSA